MTLIYITGIAGAGKSEVYKELKKRGHEVYGTDEDTLAGFYNNESGQRVGNPADVGETATTEWREHHTWQLPRSVIGDLKKKSSDKMVFLCGVASNEEEYLDLFDELFALVIDDETLLQRIATRTNNTFGKVAGELDQIKDWQASTPAYYAKYNYIQVDANRPVAQVVDDILERVESR